MAIASTIMAGVGMAASVGSLLFGGNDAEEAAKEAKKEAKRIREWYEGKAAETSKALQTEIDTMRTLRSLDFSAHEQAAQLAMHKRQQGSERLARHRMLGRLDRGVRDAVFGGQLQQYLGRESQKLQRYAGMTGQIYDMASKKQEQVNQMLQAGGSQYSQLMGQAGQMEYQAAANKQNKWGQALGVLGQGLSQAASGMAASERQDELMKTTAKQNLMTNMLFSENMPSAARLQQVGNIGNWLNTPAGTEQFNQFMGMR